MNKPLALPLMALALALLSAPLRAQSAADSLGAGSEARSLFTIPEPQTRQSNITYRSQYFGIGGMRLGHTYLTPLNYGGKVYSYTSEHTRLGYRSLPEQRVARGSLFGYTPRTTDPRWLRHTLLKVDLASTKNPAGNGSIYSLTARYDWGRLRHISDGSWGRLAIGGSVVGLAGGMYSSRNGNNPGTLDMALSVGPSALYSLRFGPARLPLLLKAYAHTDLLGFAFSQEFGETLYELYYFGQPSRRIYLTHPLKAPTGFVLTSVDVPVLDYFTLSVGYRWDYRRTELNHLSAYRHQHSLLIGVTTKILPLEGRRAADDHSTLVPF